MPNTHRTTGPGARQDADPNGTPTPNRRRIRPTGWPVTGRSMTGAALVVVAVGGVLSAHRAAVAPPATSVLTAAGPLPAGTVLSVDDLAAIPAELPADAPILAAELRDELAGRTLLRAVDAGALLAPSDVGAGGTLRPPGSTLVTIEPSAARTPRDLRPGVIVDVLATDDERGITDLIVRGAVVVGAPGGDGDGDPTAIGGSLGTRVELAVADETVATALVDAAVRHELTLVVPTPGSARG